MAALTKHIFFLYFSNNNTVLFSFSHVKIWFLILKFFEFFEKMRLPEMCFEKAT